MSANTKNQDLFKRTIHILVILLLLVSSILFVGKSSTAEIQEQISWSRGFDEQDRLTKLIDPAGRETRFEYSITPQETQRVMKVPPEGSRVIWDYDNRGRLSNMTDGSGNVSYGYDDLGRIDYIKREKEPAITYDYDMQDRIVRMGVGGLYELTYSYDFLGRLESINTPFGTITYEYRTGQGLLVRTLPNGIQTIWESAVNGQLRKITHGKSVSKDEIQVLAEYTYEYRPDGMISAIGERSARGELATFYKYDRVGRLVDATETTGRQYNYEYDQVGNRLSVMRSDGSAQVCSYDWAGRLISVNDNGCTHDSVGNLSSVTIDNTAMKYRYNTDGQLQDVNGRVSYQYDGDGMLISRKVGETETTFIPDPFSDIWQPLVIDNNSSGRTLIVWDGSAPLIMIQDGKTEYMLHDHLGSVRLIVNDQGKLIRKVDYSPFGMVQDSGSSLDFAPRYAGLFWDAKAQSYLTLARAYSPGIGKFLGQDPKKRLPFGSQKDFPNYVYCGNDPVNFVDLNGEAPQALLLTDGMGNASSGLVLPNASLQSPKQDSEHLNRNKFNIPPYGILLPKTTASLDFKYDPNGNNEYLDMIGREWRLESPALSVEHEIDGKNIYKFLSMSPDGIASSEAILVREIGSTRGGIWKNTGAQGATYNYESPEGPMFIYDPVLNSPRLSDSHWGHIWSDYLPHKMRGSNYTNYLPDLKYGSLHKSSLQGHRQTLSVDKASVRWGAFWESLSKWRFPVQPINPSAERRAKGFAFGGLLGMNLSSYKYIPGPQFPKPNEVPQRYDNGTAKRVDGSEMKPGEAKRFFIDKIVSYQLAELHKPKYGGKSLDELSKKELMRVRDIAVDKFSEHYSNYGFKPVKKEYEQEYFNYVYNMNISTDDGPSSLDWFTAVNDSKRLLWFSPVYQMLSPKQQLFVGKVPWNIVAPRFGTKEFPEGSVFEIPENNLNSLKLNKRVRNIDFSVADTFLIPKKSKTLSTYTSSRSTFNFEPPDRKQYKRRRNDVFDDIDTFIGRGPGGPGGPGGGGGAQGGLGGGGFSSMSPSTVGGVYLGGSGKMLDGMGLLEGIALDSNNNIILLSKSGDEINLPPLRLDDVVTVFRSVYIHGQGPTVTIDPNKNDPEGPIMMVVHSKATESTYAGWILFQSDKIMKEYTIGVDIDVEDKKDDKDLVSTVPGYDEVLNTLYFGDETPEKYRKEGKWERFWIVPSYARRYSNPHNTLTLCDVPLKVKTQVMKWENGELVDDPKGKSSAGATKFVGWFTKQYNAISEEQYLTPPPESGITEPVPVFSELRRIALITAIAEKLRDQGIPMPFWMRNYEVTPVPFKDTTRAIHKTRSNDKFASKVYGGANMSPDTKDVKPITTKQDIKQLPKSERKLAKEKLDRANALSEVVREFASPTEPFKHQKISLEGDSYNTIFIPGSEVRALAPCQLDEIDMIVPIDGGYEINLLRKSNSFFEPAGLWGKGWTLNLPRLEEVKVPIIRKESKVEYRMEYELLTPLNNIYSRFSRVKKVPALNNSTLQAPVKECDFFGLAYDTPTFLPFPTLALLCKNGEVWYFSKADEKRGIDRTGDLVAIEKNGFCTVYLRNVDGSVSQIAGLLGSQTVGVIDLSYDDHGRLVRVTGKNRHGEQELEYEYDSEEKLSNVVSVHGKRGYSYTGPWITSITWQDSGVSNDGKQEKKTLRSFEYNDKGQLISETDGDGQRIAYNITSGPQGNKITITNSEEKETSQSIQYDTANRPVKAIYSNGTQATWTYSDNGEDVMSLHSPEGGNIKVRESADRRRLTFDVPDMPQLTKEYDEEGRLTAILENNKRILSQHWYPDGRLQAVENDNCIAKLQFNRDGLMTDLILSPPDEKGELEHWQNIEVDIAGRPVEIKDYQGLHMLVNYDNNGNITQVHSKRDKKNYGFDIIRDDERRIKTVNSSWGKRQFTYDENGAVGEVTVDKPGREGLEQSVLKFASGQLISAKQFDGGELSISYYDEGPQENLLEQVTCANGLNLDYHYDSSNNLEKVNVGNRNQIALDYDTKGRIIGYTCRSAEK